MATKIEVLNDSTYSQFIVMGVIQAAREVLAESNNAPLGDVRKRFARSLLENPQGYVEVFKSLVIVDLDTSTWEVTSETQKINGARIKVLAIFNEAGRIF